VVAVAAIGEEAGNDPVARLDAADVGSDLLDDAGELVAEDGAGLDRDPLVVEVEVRPTDRRGCDPDQGVVGVLDRGLRDVVDANLLETLKRDRLHRSTLRSWMLCSWSSLDGLAGLIHECTDGVMS
jgi:hypothetical protein